MTKIKFYIYTLFALLLTACSESEMLTGSDGSQNGIPVVINASFRIPKTGMLSRVCGESTEITSLYALIFDENGLLSEIEECHPGTEANPQKHFSPMGANSLISFYVTLHESHSPRIVHLLANYPCSSLDIIDESHLMRKLTVSNHVDAYWQRIELRDGIIPEQNSNTPTQETRNHFQNISMIRNFAKITISKDTANIPDSKFKINGYYVFNQPKYGTVAPYNVNSNADPSDPIANRFANYIDNNGNTRTYKELYDDKYYGYEPENREYEPYDIDNIAWKVPNEPTYIYEATYREDAGNPFIILKASYNGGPDTYYKAALCYPEEREEGDDTYRTMIYYNVIRNFRFNLNVTQVSGEGSKTLQDALVSPPMNNFQGSTEAEDLNNIASENMRLFISSTDIMINDATPFQLKYKNIADKTSTPIIICNKRKSELTNTDNPNYYVTIVGLDRNTKGKGTVIESATLSDTNDADGYRTITITPTVVPQTQQIQTIAIYNSGNLYRTCKIYYRKKMDYSVEISKSGDARVDQPVKITIGIPADLTKARFPLEFHIENADNNSLYPDTQAPGFIEMPVIVDSRKHSYFYNRFITWEQYESAPNTNGIRYFDCYFRTYKAMYGTTSIPVSTNKYFNSPVNVNLEN